MSHIGARKNHVSGRIDNLGRNGRLVSVSPIGKEAENQEAKKENNCDSLDPASSDQESPLRTVIHEVPSCENRLPREPDWNHRPESPNAFRVVEGEQREPEDEAYARRLEWATEVEATICDQSTLRR